MKTRQHRPDEFKRMIVRRAENEPVQIIAEQFGLAPSLIYNWREKFPASLPESPAPRVQEAHGPIVDVATPVAQAIKNAERIYWNDDEIKQVAAEWVLLRAADPLTDSPTVLLEKAQRKALPGERQRDVASIHTMKTLCSTIYAEWKALLDKPAPAVPPPPPPVPQVITVEVPRKLTADEMLAAVDECVLEAMLAAKRRAREAEFHHLLTTLAATSNGKPAPVLPPHKPNLEAFHDGSKRPRRVAVVGLTGPEADLLMAELKPLELNAAVRFPDAKDTTTIHRCDYAIICRTGAHNSHGSDAGGDRAIHELGRSRVALLDAPTHAAIIQKIRDFAAQT